MDCEKTMKKLAEYQLTYQANKDTFSIAKNILRRGNMRQSFFKKLLREKILSKGSIRNFFVAKHLAVPMIEKLKDLGIMIESPFYFMMNPKWVEKHPDIYCKITKSK